MYPLSGQKVRLEHWLLLQFNINRNYAIFGGFISDMYSLSGQQAHTIAPG